MPHLTHDTHLMDVPLRVLVGPEQCEFLVHRNLLSASSDFFKDSIDDAFSSWMPDDHTPSSSPISSPATRRSAPTPDTTPDTPPPAIWLMGESADVFELFVLWLYHRDGFRVVVDSAVDLLVEDASGTRVVLLPPDTDTAERASVSTNVSELHWHLVNLHLFAASVGIPALQDIVMDALQDLYLRFDWSATPALFRLLYQDADPCAALRLRKWAVALLAWTLANAGVLCGVVPESVALVPEASSVLTQLLPLLLLPALAADYHAHTAKMAASRADLRIKNPQLRIASNSLRRDDRHFGFRQCAFHSHRRAVGQGRCPYIKARRPH